MVLQNLKSKACKFYLYASMLCTGIMFSMNTVYASSGDVVSKGKEIAQTIYKTIAALTLTSGGCLAAVCLFLLMFSKDEKKVGAAITWLKRIVLCVGAILLLSTIVAFIATKLIGNDGSNASLFGA